MPVVECKVGRFYILYDFILYTRDNYAYAICINQTVDSDNQICIFTV